jgi:hypothetical protein
MNKILIRNENEKYRNVSAWYYRYSYEMNEEYRKVSRKANCIV